LSYKPFVMYGPDWDDVLAPAKWPREPGVCRVLLVGGSTAQGFPSAELEAALARRFVGKKFELINAAQGGYEGRQELVVASVWGPPLAPDALISLDGANDLEHRLRVTQAGRFYLDATYEAYLTRPLLAPFAWLLSQSQLYNGILRLRQRRAVGDASQYADAIPVYIDAQRGLNALGKGLVAARLMVLQPHSAFKIPQSKEEAAFELYKYREDVMRVLYTRAAEQLAQLAARDRVAYLDGRFIYAGDGEQIFRDDVHLTARGYHRLAEAMAAALAEDAQYHPLVCKTDRPRPG
jgi:lysophospholipase L1-like esterase